MEPWVEKFETCFGISSNESNTNKVQSVRMIVGLSKYKNELTRDYDQKTPYAVVVDNGSYSIYGIDFPEIAFLTNDWLCITSTLEMLFRLLFRDHSTAIYAIAWLKRNSISPATFANYLWKRHRIVLANCDTKETQQLYNKLIKTPCVERIIVLCFGLKNPFFSNANKSVGNEKTVVFGKVIHPSSRNSHSKRFYKTWYILDDSGIINSRKSKSFLLKDFSIV